MRRMCGLRRANVSLPCVEISTRTSHALAIQVASALPDDIAKQRIRRNLPHFILHGSDRFDAEFRMDINTIRAWLGHVSLATTNIYAEVDLETKAKALAICEVEGEQTGKPWKEDAGLMEFLRTL